MSKPKISVKHLQIDKANRAVILATVSSVVIIVFGIVIGRAMFLRQGFQSRVIKEKEIAVKQLQANIEAKNKIVDAYKVFTSPQTNVLGGSTAEGAVSDKDGDNARLILDALPSKYDFPALATSVEKLLKTRGYTIASISGTDDEVAQATTDPAANPESIEIPIGFTVEKTDYEGAQNLVKLFESSIRPFKVQQLSINVQSGSMELDIQGITYYQPEKILSITKKVVK